jgi:hypothetical protein
MIKPSVCPRKALMTICTFNTVSNALNCTAGLRNSEGGKRSQRSRFTDPRSNATTWLGMSTSPKLSDKRLSDRHTMTSSIVSNNPSMHATERVRQKTAEIERYVWCTDANRVEEGLAQHVNRQRLDFPVSLIITHGGIKCGVACQDSEFHDRLRDYQG